LLFGLLWRDRRGSLRGWLGMALAAGAAAAAVVSVPGFHQGALAWRVPLMLLAGGGPAVFWVWAMVAFDDGFVPRWWHGLAWALLVAAVVGSLWVAWLAVAASALSLAFAGLATAQTVATWRADLVAGRRRLRAAVLAGTVAYIGVDTVSGLLPAGGVGWSHVDSALGLFALGVMAAWSILMVAPERKLAVPAPAELPASGIMVTTVDPLLLRRLEQMMVIERVHRQEGLTIGGLAVMLRVPEYRLRQAINEGLGYRNFNAFLNRYRIDEAKAALADASQREVPVLTIAMDAGFQSIGPFNRAFKAETGMTPSEYRRARGGG